MRRGRPSKGIRPGPSRGSPLARARIAGVGGTGSATGSTRTCRSMTRTPATRSRTQSRGRAIATNPLTIIGAGAAVLAGAEIVPAALEAGESALFTVRYLFGSGGRLGNTAVRRQLYDIAQRVHEIERVSRMLRRWSGR